MSVLDIVTLPDKVLRERTLPVTRFDEELQQLIDDMIETMREAPGVGLAAPQIGRSIKLTVIETLADVDEDGNEIEESRDLYVIANPEIIWTSRKSVKGIEGCLSIPGYVGEVTRHQAVTVRGQDLSGRKIRVKAQGFLARAFQHEVDHLEGELFIDKLTAPDRIWHVEEGQEEQAEVEGTTAELVPAEFPVEITPP